MTVTQPLTSTSTASTMVKPFGAYSNFGVNYEGESAEELTVKANLDWEIITAPINYQVEDNLYPAKDTRVICRKDTPEVNFGACGKIWKPLQNHTVIDSMIEFCKNSNGVAKLQKVGSFKKGKKVWAIATTDKEFELPGGDKVTGNILLVNSHMVGKGLQVKLLTWRQVCSNGLTLPVSIGSRVYAHNQSLTSDKIDKILNASLNCFNEFTSNSFLLSQHSLDLNVVYSFLIRQFGTPSKMNFLNPSATNLDEQPKVVKQILSLYFGGGQGSDLLSSYNTAWGLLNAISEWAQYNSKQVGGVEGHLDSLWMGAKANKNKEVYTELVRLVGV